MSRWLRVLVVTLAAAAAGALVLLVLPGRKAAARRAQTGERPAARSREDVIDELTDSDKQELVRELGRHV